VHHQMMPMRSCLAKYVKRKISFAAKVDVRPFARHVHLVIAVFAVRKRQANWY
jgi:hypothetical protein